jgi:hypothetical protein
MVLNPYTKIIPEAKNLLSNKRGESGAVILVDHILIEKSIFQRAKLCLILTTPKYNLVNFT